MKTLTKEKLSFFSWVALLTTGFLGVIIGLAIKDVFVLVLGCTALVLYRFEINDWVVYREIRKAEGQ